MCSLYPCVLLLTEKNGAWDFHEEVDVGYILHRLDCLNKHLE